LRGIVAGILERLDEKRLIDIGDVAGKLAHLIGLPAVGVLVCHGQHLIGLQRSAQRHIAQGRVQGIFGGVEQSCALQFLIVDTSHQSCSLEHGRGLIDVAGGAQLIHNGRILGVGTIRRHGQSALRPSRVADGGCLAEIGQCHDITGIGGRAVLVGHPNFNPADAHAGGQIGQSLHARIVMVSEILRKKEVTVLLIVCRAKLKRGELLAALTAHAARRTFLLRGNQLQLELAKLHVGAQSEQAAGPLHQRRVAGERHIARLYELDDLVFLAVILQFHVLRVDIHRGIGVVIQVHVHLVAHLAVDVQIDFLVEIHRRCLAVADGQRGIVDALERGTKLQFGRSLCLDAHAPRPEDLLCRTQLKAHVGEVELLLALSLVYFIVLSTEKSVAAVALAPFHILAGSHHDGCVEIGGAYLRADDIPVEGIVIHHLIAQPLRALQVHRTLVEVVVGDGRGALYLPSGMKQRVGNAVLTVQDGLPRLRHGRLVARLCRGTGGGGGDLSSPAGVNLKIRGTDSIAGHHHDQHRQR